MSMARGYECEALDALSERFVGLADGLIQHPHVAVFAAEDVRRVHTCCGVGLDESERSGFS